MNRFIHTTGTIVLLGASFGCGGSSSGIPAQDKPAPGPSEQEMQERMQKNMEDMKKHMGPNVQAPPSVEKTN